MQYILLSKMWLKISDSCGHLIYKIWIEKINFDG